MYPHDTKKLFNPLELIYMQKSEWSYYGWLPIHKPVGITSFDAVRRVKHILRPLLPKKTKIGHGGTLDPLASGVLPIAIGEATKTVDYLMYDRKTYVFEVTWGTQTITDDAEFIDDPAKPDAILNTSDKRPSQADIERILPQFQGTINQMPPQYSAKKIEGKRACDRLREGESVALQPSVITIYDLKILNHRCDRTQFEVICSKGTYVRSLARDMGQTLGCYGYASSILRSCVGKIPLDSCLSLDYLETLIEDTGGKNTLANRDKSRVLCDYILPIQAVLADIPAVLVTRDQEAQLRYGQVVVESAKENLSPDNSIKLCISDDNRAIAIVEVTPEGLKPKRVFNIF